MAIPNIQWMFKIFILTFYAGGTLDVPIPLDIYPESETPLPLF